MKLFELFKQPTNVKWQVQNREHWRARFTAGEQNYIFDADQIELDGGGRGYEVKFGLQQGGGGPLIFGNTNTGNQYEVYSAVVKCMSDLLNVHTTTTPIMFSAADDGRKGIYTRFVQKYLKAWTLQSTGDDFIAYPPHWDPEVQQEQDEADAEDARQWDW